MKSQIFTLKYLILYKYFLKKYSFKYFQGTILIKILYLAIGSDYRERGSEYRGPVEQMILKLYYYKSRLNPSLQ